MLLIDRAQRSRVGQHARHQRRRSDQVKHAPADDNADVDAPQPPTNYQHTPSTRPTSADGMAAEWFLLLRSGRSVGLLRWLVECEAGGSQPPAPGGSECPPARNPLSWRLAVRAGEQSGSVGGGAGRANAGANNGSGWAWTRVDGGADRGQVSGYGADGPGWG